MKVSTRFTVAVHTMLCIGYFQNDTKVTSDFIAGSTGVNPVIIRRLLGELQAAGLVVTRSGVGGSTLTKRADEITLLDVYKAVAEEEEDERSVFSFHTDPSAKCPVGSHIHSMLDPCLKSAQSAMEAELSKTTLGKMLKSIS